MNRQNDDSNAFLEVMLMTALLKRHRTLGLALSFPLFFAYAALATQNTASSEASWQDRPQETLVSANTMLSEPANELAGADLLSGSPDPPIFWIIGSALAGGLSLNFLLCRRNKKHAQELFQLWGDCRDSKEELKRSNQKLKALIEFAPLAINALDREGNVASWNPEAERMFGWSAQEVLGRPLPVIAKEYQARYRQINRQVENGEVIQGLEVAPLRKDGTRLIASLSVAPLFDGSGQWDGMMAILMDISQRKKAEEALRASEERYRDLFENAKDMISTRDMNGNFTSVNREYERVTGYTREELLGMNITQLVAPEYRPLLDKFMRDVNAGVSRTFLESEIVTKDGRRVPVEVNARVIYKEGKPVEVQSIVRDLSEQKELQAQLWQAQKMEAVGRLAGGVAHDFNNLLNVIGGYSEMLLDEAGKGSTLRHYAEEIRKAADQAASVTRQLLAFSRKQVLQPKVLDLNDLVTNLSKMLRRLIGEDVQVSTALKAGLGLVKADPSQLEQAIMNLVVNARDAMPQGGRLTIETANVELDEAYARLHTPCQPGPYVLLAVSDTGVGMDGQTRARIFEPFFTTKPLGKGTGLGLAMVYGIVKQSDGYIWVYSEPGHGTTFKIYLPWVEATEQVSQVRRAAEPSPRGSETVLVVEDEPAVRELAREFLESSGYQVLDADGGAAALELVKHHSGPLHLLLTDVIMPKMSGKELVAELAKLLPETKVLYMSGYTDEIIGNLGILESVTQFVQKPFTRDALANQVREVLVG
ncbi:MAG: PAS domain S-box protein [Acidobacteria bacterium]|nr:PAS domain S-box protein [Acidobacteriota bacterium]